MSRNPLGRADMRPRVHIWESDDPALTSPRFLCQHGPTGNASASPTAGAALDQALKDLKGQRAVIIWHGRCHGPGVDA